MTRQQQDEMGLMSQQRAVAATNSRIFLEEIVPLSITDQAGERVWMDKDEGVRVSTAEGLAKLKPAFGGTTTAGNASQRSDGAAAALLMTLERAQQLGWQPMAVVRSFVAVGCEPSIMGIGPAVAIPALLKKEGLRVEDIDLWEINEAFASQCVYCADQLGIPRDRLNVNGGAIALGHPLGCTGVRMTATLLNEMERRNLRFGVVSMCVGTGMGAAMLFERV